MALNAPKDEWLQKAGDGWVGAKRMRDFVALISASRSEVTIHLAGAAVLCVGMREEDYPDAVRTLVGPHLAGIHGSL